MGVLFEASASARSRNHSVITALLHGGWPALIVIALIVLQVLFIVYAVRKWRQR
jgi:hypothetical protein